jgi:hypothetical protein
MAQNFENRILQKCHRITFYIYIRVNPLKNITIVVPYLCTQDSI